MSQPIPNLPHWPLPPEASGAAMEQLRNELEVVSRSLADNNRLDRAVLQALWNAFRVLRVTGSPAAGVYTTRLQVFNNVNWDLTQAFAPASMWRDANPNNDDSYLVDASPTSNLTTGSYVASWFQLRSRDNFPTFLLMAGAGGTLPALQYQFQVLQNVAQRQLGGDWVRYHPPV